MDRALSALLAPPHAVPPGAAPAAALPPPPPPSAERWRVWDRFLETTPETGFMQSSWWADFRATAGYGHFALIFKHQSAMIGGAVVMRLSLSPQNCFYYIPEGPVLPRDESAAGEVFAAILEAIEGQRKIEPQAVSHLRIEPRWQRLPDFVRGFRVMPEFTDRYSEPRNTLCVDLRDPEEVILARMKPKGRYNIRVAQRHGVSVVEDISPRGLADFLRIYEAMGAHKGIGVKPPGYFQNLVSTLRPSQNGSVFFAEYQGVRLAAALVICFGKRATYFFGGSLDHHRHVMSPYLLHFEIMRWAKAQGLEWYDLWGVAPQDEPEHPWQAISAFKRKFGGLDLHLVPTLDYVYDAAAYAGYVAAQRDARDKVRRDALSPEPTPIPENKSETCAEQICS